MKVELKNLLPSGKGNKFTIILVALMAIFMIALAYFVFAVLSNNSKDEANLQAIAALQSQASRLGPQAIDIVSGKAASKSSLRELVAEVDAQWEALQGSDGDTMATLEQEYASVGELWLTIKEQVAEINTRSDEQAFISAANKLRSTVPAMITENDAVLRDLVRIQAPYSQINLAQQQGFLLDSMQSDTSAIAARADITLPLSDQLAADVQAFNRNLFSLTRGGQSNQAVTNAAIVERLKKIEELYATTQRDIDESLAQDRDVLSQFSANKDLLTNELATMSEKLSLLSANRVPNSTYIMGAALGFLLCLLLLPIPIFASARQRLEETQASNNQNQVAILRLLDELVDLADGDLTISATVSEDFTGAIADSINFTIDQLRQLVSRINSTAVQVSQAAQGTQQTALHLAEASDHQAQEIAGASAAINEMAVTIDQVSANASESALVAGKSVSIANNGAKLVQNTIHGMDTIREQIQDTSKRIKRLGESSQEIGDIVSLINDIADQTNILALNAAIQASMAGDAGRGFAVVADEVQRLAERSAAATKQIESLVKAIQTDTNEAVISMEQTTSEVVRGARLAQDAGVALEEIEGVSANLAELIQNISNAARQQASSAGHISNTMNVIQEITSQTSAGTSETAESIGTLASMAFDLRESVAGFTLPPEMLADLEEQQMAAAQAGVGAAAPPMLDDSDIVNDVADINGAEDVSAAMASDKSEAGDAEDFFELLADDDEDDDLLSEFDVDLSDVTFPDDDNKKPAN